MPRRALWLWAGIGLTDPGTALQHGEAAYGRYVRFLDSNLQLQQLRMLADPAAALLRRSKLPNKPICGGACEWMIENVVGGGGDVGSGGAGQGRGPSGCVW